MQPNDNHTTTNPAKPQLDEALRNWHCLTEPHQAVITIKSLATAARLAFPHIEDKSERADIEWLLWMVGYLADIVIYGEA